MQNLMDLETGWSNLDNTFIFRVVVDVLEFLERLDNVNVLLEVKNTVLGARVEKIVDDCQCLRKR